MRILITGCRGFIGGSLGRFATAAGHVVLGVARPSQADPSWPCSYISTDVAHADLASTIEEFAPDVVFHGAGTASVGASLRFPVDDLRAAVLTWANVLDSVRRSRSRPRVIFPSSAAVYGNPLRLPVREDAPVVPISPYGFHKAACELLAQEYAACFGLEVTVCRLFSVFGPAQRRLLVWDLFERYAGSVDTVWLDGTGAETRDYLHVDDVSQAVLALAVRSGGSVEEQRYTVVNVASGHETSIRELAVRVGKLAGPGKRVTFRGDPRPGDPSHWRADVTVLQGRIPEWQPRPLDTGLHDCMEAWHRHHA